MSYKLWNFALPLIFAGIALSGCNKSTDKEAGGPDGKSESAVAAHTHEDWWCAEHGVPEEECAQCNSKLAAKFKADGDWCAKHDRPDSQCFICHPELAAKFAARYEAKYNQQPPKM